MLDDAINGETPGGEDGQAQDQRFRSDAVKVGGRFPKGPGEKMIQTGGDERISWEKKGGSSSPALTEEDKFNKAFAEAVQLREEEEEQKGSRVVFVSTEAGYRKQAATVSAYVHQMTNDFLQMYPFLKKEYRKKYTAASGSSAAAQRKNAKKPADRSHVVKLRRRASVSDHSR